MHIAEVDLTSKRWINMAYKLSVTLVTEKFKLVNFFFSRANEVKTCGLVQQLMLRMLRDLILKSHDSPSLKGDPPLK